jgi:hypothetical protein
MAREVSWSCEGLGSFRLWSGELVELDEAHPPVRLGQFAEVSRLLELAFWTRKFVLSKVAAQGVFGLLEVPKPRL